MRIFHTYFKDFVVRFQNSYLSKKWISSKLFLKNFADRFENGCLIMIASKIFRRILFVDIKTFNRKIIYRYTNGKY